MIKTGAVPKNDYKFPSRIVVNAKVIITVDEATIGRNKYRPKSVVDAVLNASDANDGKPTTVLVVRTSDDPSAMKMRACDSLLEEVCCDKHVSYMVKYMYYIECIL